MCLICICPFIRITDKLASLPYSSELSEDCLLGYSPLKLFSHSVLSTLQSHGVQHTRFPCPSWSPWVCSNSCPLSLWCHLTMWSSVVPFSSYPQSFPAPGSFPISQLFASGGQRSVASASVIAMSIQGWFSLGWTGWISLLSKGRSRVSSSTTIQKVLSFLYGRSAIHGKP